MDPVEFTGFLILEFRKVEFFFLGFRGGGVTQKNKFSNLDRNCPIRGFKRTGKGW